MHRRVLPLILALAAVAAALAASASGAKQDVTLNLVAYSTPRPVLDKLIAEFKETPQGSGININASYGASSAQGQAVANGLPADGVILNTGNDMNNLVDKGLINKNWDKQSYNGVAWHSVVVFGLRNGNPKKVKGWNDLLKPGVEVVTPNPFTAGIAKWNILAAYSAQRHARQERQAGDRLRAEALQDNVVAQDSSGSNATNTFLSGKGDVLLTFESEAINAQDPVRDPAPDDADRHLHRRCPEQPAQGPVNAFSRFLKSYPAQKVLGQNGYRPVNKKALAEQSTSIPVRPGEITITTR